MISTPSWVLPKPQSLLSTLEALTSLKNMDFVLKARPHALRTLAKMAGFSLDDVDDNQIRLEAMMRANTRESILLIEFGIERQNKSHN